MAAYADRNAVLSRAGVIRGAFGEQTPVDYSAIDLFLEEVSAEIDGLLSGRGAALPLDVVGSAMLRGPVADGALVLALEGAFPGATSDLPPEVAALLAGARGRWNTFMAAVAAGRAGIVVYVDSLATGTSASNFWDTDAGYSPWTDVYAPGLGPGAARTDRF